MGGDDGILAFQRIKRKLGYNEEYDLDLIRISRKDV